MIALKSGGDIRHANMIYKVAQGINRMCLIFFSMHYCTYNRPGTTEGQGDLEKSASVKTLLFMGTL